MEFINSHAFDLLFMAIVLLLFAIAGLIYTAFAAREAALGRSLLDACEGSWEVAIMVVDDVREDHELLVGAMAKEYQRGKV